MLGLPLRLAVGRADIADWSHNVIGHRLLHKLPGLPLGLLLVLSVAALLAACGQAGAADPGVATLNSTEPGASPSPSVDPQQAFVDYARCMREHGIDMPDPQVNTGDGKFVVGISILGDGKDKQKLTDAEAACHHFIASVTLGQGGPGLDQAAQDAMLAYAKCMRDHGVDVPDPQFQEGGGVVKIGDGEASNFDPTSKTFQDAQTACQSKLPGGGKDGGPSVQFGSGDGPGTQVVPANPGAGGN